MLLFIMEKHRIWGSSKNTHLQIYSDEGIILLCALNIMSKVSGELFPGDFITVGIWDSANVLHNESKDLHLVYCLFSFVLMVKQSAKYCL